MLNGLAKRISVLSQLKLWETPFQVPWMKAPEILGESATGKEAHLLHDKVVVHAEAGRSTAWLSALGIRKSRLQHNRERRAIPISPAQGIAAQFETTAERGQLQKGGMTGRAGLSGLACVERQRRRVPR